MRLSIKKYADGGAYAVETTDDGSAITKTLEGKRDVGARISAFAEALSDDSVQGAKSLLEALEFLKQQIEERKARFEKKEKPEKKRHRKKSA